MKIHSGSPRTDSFRKFVEKHPLQTAGEVLDTLSAPLSVFPALSRPADSLARGVSEVMAAAHLVAASASLLSAARDKGHSRDHLTRALGEGLCATGQYCASHGYGPVSLGLLASGMVINHLSALQAA